MIRLKTKSYVAVSKQRPLGVGFVLPLCVDFDICIGESKCAFASLTRLQSMAKKHIRLWFDCRTKVFGVT